MAKYESELSIKRKSKLYQNDQNAIQTTQDHASGIGKRSSSMHCDQTAIELLDPTNRIVFTITTSPLCICDLGAMLLP